MSVTEVLDSILVMNDYSHGNGALILCGVIVSIIALVGILYTISQIIIGDFKDEIFKSIFMLILTVASVAFAILSFWNYKLIPVNINIYIETNNVPISQISTYFDISNVSSADEDTFMYIEPKTEYYQEALEWYNVYAGDKD